MLVAPRDIIGLPGLATLLTHVQLAVDQDPPNSCQCDCGCLMQLSNAPVCMFRQDCPFPSALVKIQAISDYSALKFL